jgi:quinol-cytochrome oxidoreductase complex cytochrome b subunit
MVGDYAGARNFFAGFFGLYILYSFIRTGAWLSFAHLNHYLYIVNFIVILLVLPRLKPDIDHKNSSLGQWILMLWGMVVAIAVLAVIAINTHGEMPGMQVRFE